MTTDLLTVRRSLWVAAKFEQQRRQVWCVVGIPSVLGPPVTHDLDWTMLTASTIDDPSTRNTFISMVYSRGDYNGTLGAFPTTYNAPGGNITRGIARCVYISLLYILTNPTEFT